MNEPHTCSDELKPATPKRRAVGPREGAGRGASGHRFGANLRCDYCGVPYREHRRTPKPCAKARAPA